MLQPAEDDGDRLTSIEKELKRLREGNAHSSVDAALGQVRALALRSSTDNAVLVAALETLADLAAAHSHEDAQQYKLVLKACQDSEALGPLHGLINKLIGTDMAKKIASSLEGWKKSLKRDDGKTPQRPQPQQQGNHQPPMMGGFYPGPPPPPWAQFGNFRGRGRGRPQGAYRTKRCFLCNSPDHLVMECGQIKKKTN